MRERLHLRERRIFYFKVFAFRVAPREICLVLFTFFFLADFSEAIILSRIDLAPSAPRSQARVGGVSSIVREKMRSPRVAFFFFSQFFQAAVQYNLPRAFLAHIKEKKNNHG